MVARLDECIRVLVVEDNPDDVSIIRRMLSQYPHARFEVQAARSASSGLEQLHQGGADVLLLDYVLPGEDGLSFLRRMVCAGAVPPVILITGWRDPRIIVEALRSGVYTFLPKDDITPTTLGTSVREALESFRQEEELSRFDDQIMLALATAAEGRDRVTAGHLQRLAHWSVRIGQAFNLEEAQLKALRYGALLHDIGKLAVSKRILRKAGPLSEEEAEEVRQHPLVGERICSALSLSRQVRPIVRHHHERWDGTGYPDALAGEEIPVAARIVGAADAYDAMSYDRSYRRALPVQEVLRRLEVGAGAQWDPQVIGMLVDLIGQDVAEGRTRHVSKAAA